MDDIACDGLIIAQAAQTTALLDELIALCEWPVLLRPSVRALLQQIDVCRPACLLFWLESVDEITSTAQIVARLRDRSPRPYRIALAHGLNGSVEQTCRMAGIHSYFAVNGNLHTLFQETLLPFVDMQRATIRSGRKARAPEPHVPVRAPTEVRGSPAVMRPP